MSVILRTLVVLALAISSIISFEYFITANDWYSPSNVLFGIIPFLFFVGAILYLTYARINEQASTIQLIIYALCCSSIIVGALTWWTYYHHTSVHPQLVDMELKHVLSKLTELGLDRTQLREQTTYYQENFDAKSITKYNTIMDLFLGLGISILGPAMLKRMQAR